VGNLFLYQVSHLNTVLLFLAEGKKTLGRPRHRWEVNIKMDHREIGWGDMDPIDLAEDRNRRVP
jgi:hypothetical protein